MDNKTITFDNTPEGTIEIEFTYRELYDMLLHDQGKLHIHVEETIHGSIWLYCELVYTVLTEGKPGDNVLISSIDNKEDGFDFLTYFIDRKNIILTNCDRKTPAALKIYQANNRLEAKPQKIKKSKFVPDDCPF